MWQNELFTIVENISVPVALWEKFHYSFLPYLHKKNVYAFVADKYTQWNTEMQFGLEQTTPIKNNWKKQQYNIYLFKCKLCPSITLFFILFPTSFDIVAEDTWHDSGNFSVSIINRIVSIKCFIIIKPAFYRIVICRIIFAHSFVVWSSFFFVFIFH